MQMPDFENGIVPGLKRLMGVSQDNEVAKEIGVPTTTFSGWVSRNSIPWLHLYKIAKKYGITLDSIIDGTAGVQTANQSQGSTLSNNLVNIPVYKTKSQSGQREALIDEVIFPKSWLNNTLNAEPEQLNIVFANGDSMEPSISSGDMLIVDSSKVKGDGIFCFKVDDTLYVKRLQYLPNQIVVTSDNEKYKPFELSKGDNFEVIGEVVGKASQLK